MEIATLLLIALGIFIFHTLTNNRYGFYKDELATIADAHYLEWGYVAYPPVTPFFARAAFELFGNSLRGYRFFPLVAQCIAAVLSGLMARELGGRRFAQATAALAVAITPASVVCGAILFYSGFDFLWWVLLAFLLIRLLRTQDERLWLPIGATIGVGMMTKYTMAFFVVGIVAGVLLTDARRYLRSQWLWLGVALSVLIFLPNVIWQVQHDFVTLDFLRFIHARDVRLGVAGTRMFFVEQLYIAINVVAIRLLLQGLRYFFAPEGRSYRFLGWTFLATLAIGFVAKAKSWYISPAYPMLLAAGAVVEEHWVNSLPSRSSRWWRVGTFVLLGLGAVLALPRYTPIVPPNSWAWKNATKDIFNNEFGWPELVAEVARIRNALPLDEQARTGILAFNYGEAGAFELYGPAYGLPKVISGVNSFWSRGYTNPPPQTLIVVGWDAKHAGKAFSDCEVAGNVPIVNGVATDLTEKVPEILVCRNLRMPWPEFWKKFRYYG